MDASFVGQSQSRSEAAVRVLLRVGLAQRCPGEMSPKEQRNSQYSVVARIFNVLKTYSWAPLFDKTTRRKRILRAATIQNTRREERNTQSKEKRNTRTKETYKLKNSIKVTNRRGESNKATPEYENDVSFLKNKSAVTKYINKSWLLLDVIHHAISPIIQETGISKEYFRGLYWLPFQTDTVVLLHRLALQRAPAASLIIVGYPLYNFSSASDPFHDAATAASSPPPPPTKEAGLLTIRITESPRRNILLTYRSLLTTVPLFFPLPPLDVSVHVSFTSSINLQ